MWLFSKQKCRNTEMQKHGLSASAFLLSAFLLSACGFSPMYSKANDKVLASGVLIEAPNDRLGRQLKENLEDRLNPEGRIPAKPAYKLVVTLGNVTSGMGVDRAGTVSRYNVTLASSYKLIDLSDNKVVQGGELKHVSSYNNQTNQYFSTIISERDSMERGITELAELYRQRIGAWLVQKST